ncbi:MAG TPA: beta-propeller fold lactonase family protein [Solirubrobacteraceae bacterium]|nr:beta-propeller fold lactonase family protein [Solirubrobacteraceae bacterium]
MTAARGRATWGWASRPGRRGLVATLGVTVVLGLAGCGGGGSHPSTSADRSGSSATSTRARTARHGPLNIYAAAGANHLSAAVRGDPALVYVPNSLSNTVDEISQRTFKIIRQFPTGALPQHVTPAWNFKTLWVDNDDGNSLTPINPRTGRPGTPVPVEDPYNLYFTPDGHYAIVVAERLQRLDFRNPTTMKLVHSLAVPECYGVDHADFSANGRYMYASCEFNGRMIEVDLRTQRVIRTITLNGGRAAPQDVKLSPDGRVLYVADQDVAGVWELNPVSFRVTGFLHTGAGAHGLYPSRDAKVLYVSNRSAGSISVVSFRTRKVIKTWQLPLPASPDMGGVSADGRTLWLSGRYNSVVYAINTQTGHLRAEIPVGAGPHGLCVWPQPGRYSLGHTGITR